MIEKHYKELKTIKKNTLMMDYYFMGKYSFSPYMACQHACKYCDGRAERYYVEGDFEKDIVIRKNVPELLKKKLGSYRESGSILIGSGVSDPYQPIEASEKIMQACLEHIADHKFSVTVMTKSSMAMRDIDLCERINNNARAILMVSIAYPNDDHRKIMEPYASNIDARFEMIRTFKKRGIPVYVMAMPLLPGISDDMDSVNALFDQLEALDVDAVMIGGLTLRPGKQKDTYFQTIQSHYPHLLPLYEDIYKGDFPSGSPMNWYVGKMMPPIHEALKLRKIPTFLPHYVYKGVYPKYDELYFLLKHMKKLYQYADINIDPLKKADAAYKEWYQVHKKFFNRKRSMPQSELENTLLEALKDPSSNVLAGNRKLTAFMIKAIFEDYVFDYKTLSLSDD